MAREKGAYISKIKGSKEKGKLQGETAEFLFIVRPKWFSNIFQSTTFLHPVCHPCLIIDKSKLLVCRVPKNTWAITAELSNFKRRKLNNVGRVVNLEFDCFYLDLTRQQQHEKEREREREQAVSIQTIRIMWLFTGTGPASLQVLCST